MWHDGLVVNDECGGADCVPQPTHSTNTFLGKFKTYTQPYIDFPFSTRTVNNYGCLTACPTTSRGSKVGEGVQYPSLHI